MDDKAWKLDVKPKEVNSVDVMRVGDKWVVYEETTNSYVTFFKDTDDRQVIDNYFNLSQTVNASDSVKKDAADIILKKIKGENKSRRKRKNKGK